MVRLVAIDLDDTLVGANLKISPRNRAAVQRLVRRGIRVVIATGRTFSTARPFLERLKLDTYAICYQGALVRKPHKTLYDRRFPMKYYQAVLQFAARNRTPACVYVPGSDQLFFNRKMDRRAKEYLDRIEQVEQIGLVDLRKFRFPSQPIKIMLIAGDDKITRLARSARRRWARKLYVTISQPTLLEFFHPHVSKGRALKIVADHYGIRLRDTVAIGDSYNDIPMLRAAGVGIAVRNAPAAVERRADYVVSSWEKDGVAEAIERFVIRRQALR